jgi:phosphoribosylformylglycinamidine synthase
MPKHGVLDPQGQAVHGALAHLGFTGVGDVRVGRRIEIDLDAADPAAEATRMCEDLLANQLIEDFTVEVDG